ncbi:Crp/Fnr family transcriptional regulator [Seohaeicola nanhaiensis]|uniref:Crp/Fnr family transcriptional regulator n=1 Tax=Seohaeicola nanhaiensis TaxID=1387282 RepID=A0ABV9KND2_9RHOB
MSPPDSGRGPQTEALDSRYRCGMVGRVDAALWQKLQAACEEIRDLDAREIFSRAGEPMTHSALLLEGTMVRYISGGGRSGPDRALVSIQVPGDFVDLHGLPLKYLDHDVSALSEARIALFANADILRIMEASADHSRQLWWLTMIDAAIHLHWLFRTNRLRAAAALADFICEMDVRLSACGLVVDDHMPLPLLQSDLAEVTGLSTVHVSRICKELREAGLCTIRDGGARLHNREGLRKLARFDDRYLYPPP